MMDALSANEMSSAAPRDAADVPSLPPANGMDVEPPQAAGANCAAPPTQPPDRVDAEPASEVLGPPEAPEIIFAAPPTQPPERVDAKLWSGASAAGWRLSCGTGGSGDKFRSPSGISIDSRERALEAAAFEDAPAVSFVLGTPEAETTAAQICALADSGPDLACGAPFRIEGRASLRPLPREAGAPVRVFDLLSAADGTDAGTLRDASGESVSDTLRPALVRPDAVIGWRLQQVGKPLLAVRLRGDAEDTRELDAPFVGAGPVDALMAPGFSAVRWEEPGKRALVLAYPWTGDFPGAPRALEAVGLLRAACTLGDASALVSDEAGAAVVDVWTGVDHARHRVEAAGTRPRCLPGAVSFLDESDGEVTVTRCDAAGCEATQARPAPPWEGPWQTRSIDLGTSLLHVFHGEGLPTFARVGEGALHLLVDAPVGEPLLLPHRGGAVLVFASGDATRAVVIDAEGAGRAPLLSEPSGS